MFFSVLLYQNNYTKQMKYMKKSLLSAIFLSFLGWCTSVDAATLTEFHTINKGMRPTDVSPYTLWYNTPATKTGVSDVWMEYALPMGNGQIGATIVGGVQNDEIQFNEKTLWEGNNNNSSNQGYFQNFGAILVKDLSDTFSKKDDSHPVNNYVRWLDIMNGVAGVRYESTETKFQRLYFTSLTDNVLVAQFSAEGKDKLYLNIAYQADGLINATRATYKDNYGTFGGSLTLIKYNTRFRILTDGTTKASTAGIRVADATYVTLLMAAQTNYDPSQKTMASAETTAMLAEKNDKRIEAAQEKGFQELMKAHTESHRALMERVSFSVGGVSEKTTDSLIDYYNASASNRQTPDGLFLEQLYFQYGRYLTIGANAEQSIHAPSNLQGIWNDRSNSSFWHCDIHADINVEMNYWPADPANLSEMHLPFLNHIIDLSQEGYPWRTFARQLKSGAPGWTVAVENNIFGGTSNWSNSSMKTMGAWYCTHLWRYYRYTLDREFLKRALPVMYEAARFIMYISEEDAQDKGTWVIPGEWSPEHGQGNTVTAFAQQTSAELMHEILTGHAELGNESPLTPEQAAELETFYAKFDKGLKIEKYTFTRDGKTFSNVPCISEWKHYPLSDPQHRHLSHLLCVYPFSQVTAYSISPEAKALFEAACNGILARNGDVTGWSMGWQTCVYARLLNGDKARSYLSQALKHSGSYVIQMSNYGGCYYNLFDSHSPFQIDGNYGCTAGVCEMLLHSYDGLAMLPALPTAWADGNVSGLKAEGNFTVDMLWKNGKLLRSELTSGSGEPLRLHNTAATDLGKSFFYLNRKRIEPVQLRNGSFVVEMKKGDRLIISSENIDDEILTAIEDTPTYRTEGGLVYDLSGRHYANISGKHGIYVVNGQKKALK